MCLVNSLMWGVLAYAAVFWLHPPVERFFSKIEYGIQVKIALVLAVILLLDLVYTLHKFAFMAKMLKQVSKLKSELEARVESIDADGNGRISREELRAAYDKLVQRVKLHLQSQRSRYPQMSSKKYAFVSSVESENLKLKASWEEIKDRFRKIK